MKERYYVDTCIYLNLWQKEVDKNIELWRLAKDFLEKTIDRENIIYFSGFILKELMYILSREEYEHKRELFNSSQFFIKESLTKEEYEEARNIEKELNGEISFYDIIHFLISRKTNSILITRDKKLIEVSTRLGIKSKKPEEIL